MSWLAFETFGETGFNGRKCKKGDGPEVQDG